MSQKRIVCTVLAGFFLFCAYITFSVLMIETAKSQPVELRSQYPEIPQCDKELWLRIKDGCP